MLDDTICHFGDVGTILSLLFYVLMEILLAINEGATLCGALCDVSSGSALFAYEPFTGLLCLPLAFYGFPGKNGLKTD